MGFEPTTNGTTNHYSNQLSYSHRFKVMQNYGVLVNWTRKIFTCSHVHMFICSHRGVYCLKMKLLPFNLYFVGMGMAIYMFTYSHVHMFISRVGAWKWGCYLRYVHMFKWCVSKGSTQVFRQAQRKCFDKLNASVSTSSTQAYRYAQRYVHIQVLTWKLSHYRLFYFVVMGLPSKLGRRQIDMNTDKNCVFIGTGIETCSTSLTILTYSPQWTYSPLS